MFSFRLGDALPRPSPIDTEHRKMIRVCHVQVQPILSGVQRSMLDTLRHLDRDVFQPSVVCQSEGPLTEELRARDIPFHLIPALGREVRPLKDLRACRALTRLFQRQQFDIVHNQSAKPRVVALLAARRAGVPIVINHIRGYSFHEHTPWLAQVVYRRIEAWAARKCDMTLFVNNEDRRDAIARNLAPSAACRTIYNGADLVAFSPKRSEIRREALRIRFGWAEDEIVILAVGRLDDQKQPLILPHVARRLEALHLDKPWRIAVVGDGRLRAPLEEAISRYDLGHRVQLMGWQSSPADILRAGDVVLLTSLWEGLPRVLIEAHAAGLPCVASNIRGNREVVSDMTGMLVEPHRVAGYATALMRLIEDRSLRVQLGRAARARAERLFDSRENNAAIIRLYCELLQIPLPQRRREAA
jgi:glycosyltransferase involved in cell wall biosynthesis